MKETVLVTESLKTRHFRGDIFMKNVLKDYLDTEKQLLELQRKIEVLQQNPKLQREIEFKEKLNDLMEEYDQNAIQVISLLEPQTVAVPKGKKRAQSTYINPHTGEKVVTAGGNHKVLNEWRNKYGAEEVQSWKE